MCPSYSHGRGVKLYRYYVSAPLQQGKSRPKDDSVLRRVAATPLEAHITKAVERLAPSFENAPLELPSRVEVRQDALRLFMPLRHLEGIEAGLVEGESVTPDDRDPGQMCLALPFRPRRRGEKTVVLDANAHPSRPDPVLVKALRAAHAMLRQDPCGFPTLEAIPATPYRRQIIRLAFLAPGLQRAILRGSQPRDLTLARLTDGTRPPCWHEQRRMFGVERPTHG